MDSTEAPEEDHDQNVPEGRRMLPPSTNGVGVSVEATPRR